MGKTVWSGLMAVAEDVERERMWRGSVCGEGAYVEREDVEREDVEREDVEMGDVEMGD